jgi:hypothetical protein
MKNKHKVGNMYYLFENHHRAVSNVAIKIVGKTRDKFRIQYFDSNHIYYYSKDFFNDKKFVQINSKLARLFYL